MMTRVMRERRQADLVARLQAQPPAPRGLAVAPDRGTAMVETRVRVLSTSGGISFVEATEQNGCGACASQGSCGISGLGRYFSHKRQPIALACGDTRAGQEITVAVAELDLLKVGLWTYLLPVTLAVIGASLAAPTGDAASALSAGLGLATGLLIARRFAGIPRISITSGEQP